jgi:hypothetical protein
LFAAFPKFLFEKQAHTSYDFLPMRVSSPDALRNGKRGNPQPLDVSNAGWLAALSAAKAANTQVSGCNKESAVEFSGIHIAFTQQFLGSISRVVLYELRAHPKFEESE